MSEINFKTLGLGDEITRTVVAEAFLPLFDPDEQGLLDKITAEIVDAGENYGVEFLQVEDHIDPLPDGSFRVMVRLRVVSIDEEIRLKGGIGFGWVIIIIVAAATSLALNTSVREDFTSVARALAGAAPSVLRSGAVIAIAAAAVLLLLPFVKRFPA